MKTFSLVLAWVWLHLPQITATVSVIVMLGRAVPSTTYASLEKDWPRLMNLLRALRALFPDIVKAAKAIYFVWTGKQWPTNSTITISNTPTPPPLPLLLTLVLFLSCSSSAQQIQARALDVVGRVSNTARDQWLREYRRQLTETADTACGNVTPCADPQAAEDAVNVVKSQWNAVFVAWALYVTIHDTYSTQVEACRTVDAACAVNFVLITGEVMQHQTELRCALRRVGVADPFPGPLTCDSTVNDTGVEQ